MPASKGPDPQRIGEYLASLAERVEGPLTPMDILEDARADNADSLDADGKMDRLIKASDIILALEVEGEPPEWLQKARIEARKTKDDLQSGPHSSDPD